MVLPLTPCTVIENVPVGVELFVTMVSVDCADPLADGVTVCGLNPVPESTWLPGRLSTVSATPLLNPFWLCTVTV